MGRTLIRTASLGLILMYPAHARAEGTTFVGLTSVGGLRPSVGWAISHCPSVVGFEIEFFGTRGGATADRSSAGGISGSVIVQPATTSNIQYFAIGGVGIWGETFHEGGGIFRAKNLGGGVKVRIAGPLRLRLDYRLFLIGDLEDGDHGPTTRLPQRFSAGLHLVF